MAVEFQCEHCDALLSAEAEAGAEVECPHCGQAAVVPEGLAALPSPQVPGQSPPPVPTDQAAADAPADEPSPEATDENGEPLDEEEEDEEHHEPSAMMKWLSDSVPWVISLFATLTVFLILWFINMLVIYGKPEDVPVPDIVQSQQPGGSISPADMATSDRSRTVRPTPTRKFSNRTSTCGTMSRNISLPPDSFKFRVTLFLLRFAQRKYALSPLAVKGGPQCRVSSPRSGRSILMTSAPRSPSNMDANGPARTRERSRMVMPDSAPGGSDMLTLLFSFVISLTFVA